MDHFVVGEVAVDVPTYLMNHSDPSGHGFLALGRRPISTHGPVAENTQGHSRKLSDFARLGIFRDVVLNFYPKPPRSFSRTPS